MIRYLCLFFHLGCLLDVFFRLFLFICGHQFFGFCFEDFDLVVKFLLLFLKSLDLDIKVIECGFDLDFLLSYLFCFRFWGWCRSWFLFLFSSKQLVKERHLLIYITLYISFGAQEYITSDSNRKTREGLKNKK